MNNLKTMAIIYETILSRFSVRRFDTESSDNAKLSDTNTILDNIDGLNLNNEFECLVFKYDQNDKTARVLGVFGRIFSAPYFLAPFITGDLFSIVDLGFRAQMAILRLWALGIGSCYIGCVHNQKRVIDLLGLPKNARIISMVVFGIPSKDQNKYLYQRISQVFTRSKSRLDTSGLFLDGPSNTTSNKDDILKRIIEAGRFAPSATNSQPWRFKIDGNYFGIYAKRKTLAKIYDLDQEYALHDVGICMANMSAAANSLGTKIKWEKIFDGNKTKYDGLIPVARFNKDRLRGSP